MYCYVCDNDDRNFRESLPSGYTHWSSGYKRYVYLKVQIALIKAGATYG